MFSFRRKYVPFALLPILALAGGGAPSCKADGKKLYPFGGRLPPSASDIHEQDIDMFPDWEYYFRASMPAQDCEALLAKVASQEGLQPISEHRWLDGRGDWGPATPPAWWEPTWADGHHHGRSGDVNTCSMCRGGIFYYWTGAH
jgi:hypothetical protein